MCLRRIQSGEIFPGGLTSKQAMQGLCKIGEHSLSQRAWCIGTFPHSKASYCARESRQLMETGARTVTAEGVFCWLGGSPSHKWLVWPQLGFASSGLHVPVLTLWYSVWSEQRLNQQSGLPFKSARGKHIALLLLCLVRCSKMLAALFGQRSDYYPHNA